MEETKVKDESFFITYGWMVNHLNLKGCELSIYAIIYGFNKSGNIFDGSISYLSDFTGYSEKTVKRSLKSLSDKELIIKTKLKARGFIDYCEYIINKDKIYKGQNDPGDKGNVTLLDNHKGQNDPGETNYQGQNDPGTRDKMTLNNIEDIIYNNNKIDVNQRLIEISNKLLNDKVIVSKESQCKLLNIQKFWNSFLEEKIDILNYDSGAIHKTINQINNYGIDIFKKAISFYVNDNGNRNDYYTFLDVSDDYIYYASEYDNYNDYVESNIINIE